MYNWIIEADIYRLAKAIREQEDAQERRRLAALLAAKRQQLSIATAASTLDEAPHSTPYNAAAGAATVQVAAVRAAS